MSPLYRPSGEIARPGMRAGPLLLAVLGLVAVLLACLTCPQCPVVSSLAFVSAAQGQGGRSPALAALRRSGIGQPLRAEPAGKEIADAEVVGEDEEADEDEGEAIAPESEAAVETAGSKGAYPPEAYADYGSDESPDESWFERRKIDRHKVNNVFFDMFKKPKTFFPHKLQAGDTVRVFYLQPTPQGDKQVADYKSFDPKSLKELYFDGVILNFKGEYHARTMTMRAMIGKGENSMGYEFQFPMHSPLVTKIDVLRRGYIGRNKNAYFMRGMIGKRNVIPLDKERTEMDEMYATLREEDRADEIPEPEYPQQEWDRYPLPVWKQDLDDWDEEKYAPEDVDQRSEYERRVIAKYRKRISPSGKYGWSKR